MNNTEVPVVVAEVIHILITLPTPIPIPNIMDLTVEEAIEDTAEVKTDAHCKTNGPLPLNKRQIGRASCRERV